jgi:hypothetical protein
MAAIVIGASMAFGALLSGLQALSGLPLPH